MEIMNFTEFKDSVSKGNRRFEHVRLHDVEGFDLRDFDPIYRLDFFDVEMPNAILENANLSNYHFNRCRLYTAQADNVNFSHARFDNTSLEDASLVGANFSHSILVKVDFDGADLFGANLDGAILSHVQLYGAKGIRSISGVGGQNRTIYGVAQSNGGLLIQAGCFWGTPLKIRKAIEQRYRNDDLLEDYLLKDYLSCVKLLVSWRKTLPQNHEVLSEIPF